MACGSVSNTLVGFASELDWRPLEFVIPIPRIRVCSACGLVRQKSAVRSCMHVVCGSCYYQCAQDGVIVCPLDDLQCPEEDVEWKEWAADELLKRQVRCWNKEHGCESVMAASAISQHMERECKHHSALCPKCSTAVLCADVCAHLRSNCGTAAPSPLSACHGQFGNGDKATLLPTSSRSIEESAREMKASLERLTADVGTHGDRLSEISHGMNGIKETLIKKVDQATKDICNDFTKQGCEISTLFEEMKCSMARSDTVSDLSRIVNTLHKTLKDALTSAMKKTSNHFSDMATAIEALKAEAKQNGKKTTDCINELLRHAQLQVACCEFFVRGFKSLSEKALQDGRADFKGEKVYLRGYCVLPGIHLRKEGKSVTLHIAFRMLKGDMDDVVQWPMVHRVRLSITHPLYDKGCHLEYKPERSDKNFQRPAVTGGDRAEGFIYVLAPSLELSVLTRDGYVLDDQIRVKWELLP